MTTFSLSELEKDLATATELLKAAEFRESNARGETANCRRRLVDIQKKIDAVVTEMKKSAPYGTDWHIEIHGHGVSVPNG
jgi:hypothetical protein